MDRTFASGAVGSAPAAPASPSVGYPTAGNPGTGTPATKPGPYWYHQITEELLAIIAAAGITPAQGTLTQLRDAIAAIYAPRLSPVLTGTPTAPNPTTGVRSQQLATMQKFADEFAAFLSGNGYQKLSSGLIIQWGDVTSASTTGTLFTFPIAFPTSCFISGAWLNNNVASSTVLATTATLTGVTVYTSAGTAGGRWFALGK